MLTTRTLELEELVEQAYRARLIQYTRTNGETVTLQIGRVIYSTSREKAVGLLRTALNSNLRRQPPEPAAGNIG